MSHAPGSVAPPLSERELTRSMFLNVVAGVCGTFWVASAFGMPLPLLMERLRVSGFELGILAAVRQLSMLAQLPAAFLAEWLPRRKPFWGTVALVHRGLWLVPALLPWVWRDGREYWAISIIIALGLSEMLGMASTAAWQSWMADLIPPDRAGRFWGRRQRVHSTFLIIAAVTYGCSLDIFSSEDGAFLGFTIVFLMTAVLGMADIIIHWFVHEPEPHRSAPETTAWERVKAPLRSRDFVWFTLAMGVWAAALAMPGYSNSQGVPGFFCVVYLKEAFGASYSQASWIVITSALGTVLAAPKVGHFIDRHGARWVLRRIMVIGPAFTLLWLTVSMQSWTLPVVGTVPLAVVLMSGVSLITGALFGGALLCQYRLSQALTPRVGRTVAMAVHWSGVGIIGSFGALAGGWIKDAIGYAWLPPWYPGGAPVSYFQMLIVLQVGLIWSVALPMLRRVERDAEPES